MVRYHGIVLPIIDTETHLHTSHIVSFAFASCNATDSNAVEEEVVVDDKSADRHVGACFRIRRSPETAVREMVFVGSEPGDRTLQTFAAVVFDLNHRKS